MKTAVRIETWTGPDAQPEQYHAAKEDTGEVYRILFGLTHSHLAASGLSAWTRRAVLGEEMDFIQEGAGAHMAIVAVQDIPRAW